MRSRSVVLVLLYVHCCIEPSLEIPTGVECPPLSGVPAGCACKSDQGVIDLRPLSSSSGDPRFAKDQSYQPTRISRDLQEFWNLKPMPAWGLKAKLSCIAIYHADVWHVIGTYYLCTHRFTGLSDPNNFLYDFNPCHTFTTAGECSDVYVRARRSSSFCV